MESGVITARLEDLLMDPNNYRFVDLPEYEKVEDAKADDPKIQLRIQNWLLGKNNENVGDLIASYRANGFLNLDQIQVRKINNKFLVLEGNRRIATLKYLHHEYENRGMSIGSLSESIFQRIPIVQHEEGETKSHLLAMGLHHISGKKRWSAVNQARFVRDMMEVHGMTEVQICNSLGITKHYFRRTLRTLSIIDTYLKSDYGDQFTSDMYSLFEEVIKKPELKNWLEWSEEDWTPQNSKRMDQLFSWISKDEIRDEENGDVIKKLEPIITKSHEIRELSKFIADVKAVEEMEQSRSLAIGYAASNGSRGIERLNEALRNIEHEIGTVFGFSNLLDPERTLQIRGIQEKIAKIVPSGFGFSEGTDARIELLFPAILNHFSEVKIPHYRKLNDITLRKVSLINLIVGANNAGKTTLLEAIYTLVHLNNLNGQMELERLRGKFSSTINARWIDRNLEGIQYEIEGTFNGKQVSVNIRSEESSEPSNKAGYLSTLVLDAEVEGAAFEANLHLFSDRNPEFNYSQGRMLCRTAFSSPFRANSALLQKAHSDAVIEKKFDRIIQFLHDNLDETIQNVELISQEREFRFYVNSAAFEKSLDLTKYGEGLQRVFEIALLMVYCRHGVLCIDELDSAIHKSLLNKFTAFIESFAKEMNVQVFLTTHSKECIDAFVQNEFLENNLTAYQLGIGAGGKVKCRFLEGTELKLMVEKMDLDIR